MSKSKESFITHKTTPSELLDSSEFLYLAGVYLAKNGGFEGLFLNHVEQDWAHRWVMHAHFCAPRNIGLSQNRIESSDKGGCFRDSAAQYCVNGAIIRNHGEKIGKVNSNFNKGSTNCNGFWQPNWTWTLDCHFFFFYQFNLILTFPYSPCRAFQASIGRCMELLRSTGSFSKLTSVKTQSPK